jgi:hypothetical protein
VHALGLRRAQAAGVVRQYLAPEDVRLMRRMVG